ncbi:reverse transcriptase domain-containing protein [Tanacetum coccineum]
MKISQYVIEEGVLFKMSCLSLMLRSVRPLQANYIIREVHEGACEMYAGARPFYQWNLDILGPLPEGPGKLKFIIVAIYYFTKWMEPKPLAKTTVSKQSIQKLVCKMEDQADEHGGGAPASQRTGGERKQVSNVRPQGKASVTPQNWFLSIYLRECHKNEFDYDFYKLEDVT